tara:strand:+ start:10973 stop:11560 length:588 start_codon:yes stop_codon:yes gene_type:complete
MVAKAYHSGDKEADNSQTPWWLIRQLQDIVNVKFIIDACARENSAKASDWYTAEDDALKQCWSTKYIYRQRNSNHERGSNSAIWMNPPFSLAKEFTSKAANESIHGVVTLGCVKHAPDATWFQHMEKQATFIYVPDKRIQFLKHDGKPFTRTDPHTGKEVRSGANFPLCFPLWTPFYNGGEAKQIRFKTEKEKYS